MTGQPGRVVIVGAGPAGMALAYLLARRGVDVTVLETHHDFARAFRGEGLQQSGIDAFRQMGLGQQFDRLPHIEARTIEIYSGGRLCVRADAARLGRGQARAVSQPAPLQLLADGAGKHPSFRLDRGVTMRDFLRENGRVVGVRASAGGRWPSHSSIQASELRSAPAVPLGIKKPTWSWPSAVGKATAVRFAAGSTSAVARSGKPSG